VPDPVDVEGVLKRAECGRPSEAGAIGSRACLGTEEVVGTEDEVYAFCSDRFEREFEA
jgi:hypothetical protein